MDVEKLPLVEAKSEEDCTICAHSFVEGEKVIGLACSHSFHRECIMTWFEDRDTCPLCRSI
ncbi:hypothetical protein Tsubulata_041193, partial [Turnera subulata]